jgi:cytochrome bd-type quinol oxidase subunit 1
MEPLFQGVAKQHGVDVSVVRQYSRERDMVVDVPVILSFGVVYAVVAYVFAGRIRRRFPPGEPDFWVMTIAMAIGVSLVGLLAGGLWSIVIETVRLNSGHLSYRMNRIPFRQHWAMIWICAFIVFVSAALIRK